MENFTPWMSLLGGAMIGLASATVLYSQGRVAGVSGICGTALQPGTTDRGWRLAFLFGLVATGVIAFAMQPQAFAGITGTPVVWMIPAGLLVGFGTRLGNGCTSGHGVCGISRFSRRSIVATCTFMFTAGVTVFAMRHVMGVG